MTSFGTFGLEFQKVGAQNFLFEYFWDRIFKNYCLIWNEHPQICQIVKFCEKAKMLQFGKKNALLGYF